MKRLQGTLSLPGSKSESNRALMIAAYGGFPLEVDGLSDAHDTVLLKNLLSATSLRAQRSNPLVVERVDCEDAGTVARFMLTYLAGRPGTWTLTGTKRLCERPMAPLIDALRQLGADIKGESLPLMIKGKPLKGGTVALDASLSSQFASSLLMAAPTWENGLELTLTGDPVSMPYLEMTVKMMEYYGVHVAREGTTFLVGHQTYQPRPFTVSPDWSAASYWYEMLALSEGGTLLLNGLKPDSLQGDAVVADFFKPLGVRTEYADEGVSIMSEGVLPPIAKPLEFDVSNTPDVFPSILVSCVTLHIEAVFYGISTLFLKESDRVNSLIAELSKYYTFINIIVDNSLIIRKSSFKGDQVNGTNLFFSTFGDHRLAMALAGLKVRFEKVVLARSDVVNKSYPTFWDDVGRLVGS